MTKAQKNTVIAVALGGIAVSLFNTFVLPRVTNALNGD